MSTFIVANFIIVSSKCLKLTVKGHVIFSIKLKVDCMLYTMLLTIGLLMVRRNIWYCGKDIQDRRLRGRVSIISNLLMMMDGMRPLRCARGRLGIE